MEPPKVYDPLDAAQHLGRYLVNEFRGVQDLVKPSVAMRKSCFIELGGAQVCEKLTCLVMEYVKCHLGDEKSLKLFVDLKTDGPYVFIQAHWIKTSLRASIGNTQLANRICEICNLWKPAAVFKNCSRCKKTGYCSVDCQRQDWSFHRNVCF